MSDKEILEVLKNQADDIVVPEKLKPENITKLLENAENDNVISQDVLKSGKKKKSKLVKGIIAVAGAAAVIALVIAGSRIGNKIYIDNIVYGTVVDNGFKKLESYEKLSEYLVAREKEANRVTIKDKISDIIYGYGSIKNDAILTETENALESSSPTANKGQDFSGSSDEMNSEEEFSDTNVRTEGVAEADCIKTDGKYIYVLCGTELNIIKPGGENTKYINKVDIKTLIDKKLGGNFAIDTEDMIVYSDKIIVLGQREQEGRDDKGATYVMVFDAGNIQDISVIECFEIDGRYLECRMYNEYLYICTKYYFDEYDIENITPEINGKDFECDNIYLADNEDYNSYYTISSYKITDEPVLIDYKAVINDGQVRAYVTTGNIYLMSEYYKNSKSSLEILKFSYSDGKIEAKATACVDGWFEDVFCADEYKGYLRMVVTSIKYGDEINTLYVFDENLKETGKIEDIAPGERVYSARFDGEVGYFVTFEQVDPLFSVDLSNPAAPKIIGALKIPGFSEYMHFWGEGKMLGIGREEGQIKLSMFNIEDSANVTEEDKCILKNTYYSDSLYNHKAIFVNYEKNIIGFDSENLYETKNDLRYGRVYNIYSYENGEFVKKQELLIYDEEEQDYYCNIRGMYIGDYIYIVSQSGCTRVLDVNTFEKVATVYEND